MATKKQKQDLVDTLKFIPRDITITFSGRGGEIVMGEIPEETYNFWKNSDIDLEDLANDWDGELDVPAEHRFITDGAWHENDNICHESGCEMSDTSGISVYDELEQKVIFESGLDPSELDDHGITVEESGEYYITDQPEGTCVFTGQSYEKGTFFSATFKITKPFDPKLLTISYNDCQGWMLANPYIVYDGEEIDGADMDTSNKGCYFDIVRVGDD